MRRHLHIVFAAAAVILSPLAGHAQTVTCAQNDTTCRVLHNDLAAILKAIQAGGGSNTGTAVGTTDPGGTTTPPVVTPPVVTPPAPTGQVAALTVGPGQAIVEPADALGNMLPGGVLTVLPGRYVKTFANSTAGLTIKCQTAMKCIVDGQGGYGAGHRMAWGKACMLTTATLTIEGFKFVNCGSPASGNNYSNETAIYLDNDGVVGNNPVLTVRHNSFDNNANGVFAANQAGSVIVDENVFGFAAPNGLNGYANGTANGPAHDLYLAAASVEVKGSYFYGSVAHNVKTRTPDTNVHDNPVMTYDGGRVVDLSDGGKLTFTNNSVWFRDDATFPKRTIPGGLRAGLWGNSNLLGVGTENVNSGAPSGSITGSTFNITRLNSTFWVNKGALTASDNHVNLFGSGSLQIQGNLTGDISAASALPGAAAHAPAPPLPPSAWFSP
jgi:hypothetical protein